MTDTTPRHLPPAHTLNPEPFAMGRLLTLKEVRSEVGLSKSEIYRRMNAGDFPRPRKIGKRAVRWPSTTIERFKRDYAREWTPPD